MIELEYVLLISMLSVAFLVGSATTLIVLRSIGKRVLGWHKAIEGRRGPEGRS